MCTTQLYNAISVVVYIYMCIDITTCRTCSYNKQDSKGSRKYLSFPFNAMTIHLHPVHMVDSIYINKDFTITVTITN